MKFYRYRKAERGLDELENNHIFFSDIGSSNDPVGEGEITVYWQGDRIAWQGLLKNYVSSIVHCMDLYAVGASPDDLKNFVSIPDIKVYDNVPLGKILFSIRQQFLHQDNISYLCRKLAESDKDISVERLKLIMFLIYSDAAKLVIKELSSKVEWYQNFQNAFDKLDKVKTLIKPNTKNDLIDLLTDTSEDKVLAYYQVLEDELDIWIGSVKDKREKAFFELIARFPFNYVESLKQYIHPEVYIACFSKTPHDGQMWGNYAGNATGVSIIYESILEKDEEKLPLYEQYSTYSNDTEWKTEWRYRNVPFHEIKYSNKVEKVNFFLSLGRFSVEQLESWLCSDTGNASASLKYIYENTDVWRENYWKVFFYRYYRKSQDWAHEQEYRLTIDNSFWDYSDKKNRLIHINPQNIVGVILGPKICEEDKYRYYSLIRRLKEINKYPVFDIYQAYEKDGRLYHRKILL